MDLVYCFECHRDVDVETHPAAFSSAHLAFAKRSRKAAERETRIRPAPAPTRKPQGTLVSAGFVEVGELAATAPERQHALTDRQRAEAGRKKAIAALDMERRKNDDRRDHSLDFVWSPPNRIRPSR